MNLARLQITPKSGSEPLHIANEPIGLLLQDFWRWSASDLVSNTTRGVFAEFLVATALGIPPSHPRVEWAPWDLTTQDGIRVEVKSAAYLQSWDQEALSKIGFDIAPTKTWNRTTKKRDGEVKRQSDVYVLCLLAHQDKRTVDPMDLDQWQFYVLPTQVLDRERAKKQQLSLRMLTRLHGPAVPFPGIHAAVAAAANP